MTADLTASIHARLLNLAKARGEDFNLILTRYAMERFLYRLSLVPARDVYWLKGALLFDLWFDVPHRPTELDNLAQSACGGILPAVWENRFTIAYLLLSLGAMHVFRFTFAAAHITPCVQGAILVKEAQV